MADHNVPQFELTYAPNSWPVVNSGSPLDVYPNELIYFDVKYKPVPDNPPYEVWINSPAGGAYASGGALWQSTRGVFSWRNTWWYTVPSNATAGLHTLYWEGADDNQPSGWWDHLTGFRRAYSLNILEPLVCELDAPTGTMAITIAGQAYNTYSLVTTATLSGLTTGANCTMQARAPTSAQLSQGSNVPGWVNTPTPPNLRSWNVVRGIPYTFQVKHAEKPDSTALNYVATPPHIPADDTITMGASNYNTSDGYWTATFTGVAQIGGVYKVKIAGQSAFLYKAITGEDIEASPAAFGTGILYNDYAAQTPTGVTTIQVWVKQGSGAGGDGIFRNTGVTFTVTRGVAHNEEIGNNTGTYFDNLTGDGAAHSVTLSGLTADYYYNVSASSANINTALSTWTSSAVTSKIITDASITSLPSGSATTSSTYHLWRSPNSDGSSPASTVQPYVRYLANYSRFAFADATKTLDGVETTLTQTISNTISGHIYYIYNGSNIVGQGNGNGGALTISVSDTSIPDPGQQATHVLKTLSTVNSDTGEAYLTGASYTVTRTGTSTDDPPPPPPPPVTGEYGLEIYAAGSETVKLYDTQSLTGRIVQSGRVPSSGTIAASGNADQEVIGMANSDDFVVVAVPQTSGSGSSGTEAAVDGHNFTLTKATDEFNIRNNGAVANYYHYFVIKNGGS